MFACPRDNGANVLQKGFRKGAPSGSHEQSSQQCANHAFTEWRLIPLLACPAQEHIGCSMFSPETWGIGFIFSPVL